GNLMGRLFILSALTIVGAACSSSEITLGGALDVTISSNAPVSASDSLTLDYIVIGRSLAGMEIRWGDSQVDSVSFLGAQSAGGSESHLYDSAGTYTIQATVIDQLQGSDVAELSVTINP
ncbi:MAG: hypothetical protein L7S64_03840, partial [Longimicrobiales bacterium]|nr:hypothetical protein [Longimicrobiales bacterium]